MLVIYTLAQYNTLVEAIALGATEVAYGDKKVVYRSISDMLRLLSLMQAQLFLNRKNDGKRFTSFSKGTYCGHRRGRFNQD